MRSVILYGLFFTLLIGCKSQSTLTETNISDSDSVRVETRIDTIWGTTLVRDTVFIKVKDPQSNNVVITDPCDSLTGLLRRFEIRAGNTTVTSDGAGLSIQTECDSIVEVNKKLTMSEERFLGKIRELQEQAKEKGLIVKTSEKTGVVGWFEKWRIGIGWFLAGVIISTIFWFIMRIIGKV